ncbi:MAG: hypothetical protein QM687_02140 [Ferruginibacter sp.]
MKKSITVISILLLSLSAFSQRPSKEQMEADRKKLAEAMKNLEEKRNNLDPESKRRYDSMLNSMGMGQRMDNTITQVNSNSSANTKNKGTTGLVPAKNSKQIAAIAATPSAVGMGAYIGTASNKVLAAVLPAAKNKANEIYQGLKTKKSTPDQSGKVAAMLWLQGRTQVALSLMAQVCNDDPANTDNLNNYASMLQMMGAPELAIPVLNNLNARFKNNSTILNNLGQAWFALGDIDKADKYLDSTLRIAVAHPQANLTKSIIAESKGNKTAAVAFAKSAFKQSFSSSKRDKLSALGYKTGPDDYNYPASKKSSDLLNLGGFAMPPFPLSVAQMKALEPVWKSFRADIDQRLKSLKKITDEANKATVKRLEEQQQQFMNARNKVLSDPNSVSQSSAVAIAGAPLFAEKVNAKQKLLLENLGKKKLATIQRIADFEKGEGAALKKKYEDARKKVDEAMKQAEKNSASQTVDPAFFCPQYVKAADEFLQAYNTKLEGLYNDYLTAEKQLITEMAYTAQYSTYPELLPGVNAGLQMQWLRDLSLTQNQFNYQTVTKYDCTDVADGKSGRLTAFKDPNCDINSEFSQKLGLANLGFSIKLDCSGMTTSFNALIVGVKLSQDLDHAGFGDSFKSCTVSIGPKAGVDVKMGPVEASAKAGAGVDIEIDRSGISDVVLTGGVEAEAGLGNPVAASAGMEANISLSSGAGSVSGIGIFDNK